MIRIPTDEEISWFIGLHEGDGCFYVGPKVTGFQACFSVTLKDQDVVQRIQQVWGTGNMYIVQPPVTNPNWSVKYKWSLNARQDVLDVCNLIFPHLTMIRMQQMALGLHKLNQYIPAFTLVHLDDVQWLAGILEAEGHFNTKHKQIQVRMCDKATVDRIERVYQGLCGTTRNVTGPYVPQHKDKRPNRNTAKWAPAYHLYMSRAQDVKTICTILQPLMGQRKQQAVTQLLSMIK